ncbi:unnamed protein product, partial [marine sediment metagenome]
MFFGIKKYLFILIFLIFVLGISINPVHAQEMPIPISVANLNIFVQVDEEGQLSVSELFSFSEKPSGIFSWQINAEKISDLKIIKAGQQLSDSAYQV